MFNQTTSSLNCLSFVIEDHSMQCRIFCYPGKLLSFLIDFLKLVLKFDYLSIIPGVCTRFLRIDSEDKSRKKLTVN